MSDTSEHLEHAEHAEHAAHNPFDRKVALTMAIVAATLAAVSLLSHREHNLTILEQAHATTKHTQASDDWNFFQAKNIRMHQYKAFSTLVGTLSKESVDEEKAKKAKGFWDGKAQIYDETDLPKLKKIAEDRVQEAKKHEALSHAAHERSNFFDIGELFIHLALVLCAVALLTKMKSFWFTGIASAVVGTVAAALAFTPAVHMFSHHEAHDDHSPPANSAPKTPGEGGAAH